ncbi:hypothetical protein [Shumkonia mesophila]|uniref:hypothetical protein n=1 Tax=Shumkonia mesophila TaxID=2838854 RepID=UPI0029343AFD|nr:hypothetical protein [Shumkonia mesophila]
MTDAERTRRFLAARAAQVKRYNEAFRATAGEVTKILQSAGDLVRAELAATASEFQAWQLPNIQGNIDKALAGIGEDLAKAGGAGTTRGHAIGVDLIDESVRAGGIRLSAVLPEVDVRQLMAIRTFMTDRLRNVTAEVAGRVRSQIGLSMVGAQTPGDAVSAVAGMIEGGRGRAITIVRTEMGRAFSVAAQERQEQAAIYLPGLKKQWRRSGKVHSRIAHDLADGQIVDVDQPFIVGGHRLMFPRDPAAPPSETINCGCTSLPYMEEWDVRQPGRQPLSKEEIARNPAKRILRPFFED